MANDTIKGAGDVYQKDLYGDLTMSAEQALEVLLAINKALAAQTKNSSKIINIEAKDVETLNELNKGIEKVNQSFDEKVKIDKERVSLQKKIAAQEKIEGKLIADIDIKVQKLTSSRSALLKKQKEADAQRRAGNDEIADAIDLTEQERQELAKLSTDLILVKTERTELNKANKALAQETLGLVDSYKEESIRLNKLRKELKNYILSGKEATKETIDLAKEIETLDKRLKDADATVGQFQRNVGNYPDAADDVADANEEVGKSFKDMAKDAVIAFGVLAAGKASLDNLHESLEENAEASEELRKVTAGLEGGVGEAKNVVASTALDLFDLGKGLKDGSINALDLVKSVSLMSIGLGDFDKSATRSEKSFKRTTKATTDFSQKVLDAANAEIEAETRTIAFEKVLRGLEIQISSINRAITEQNIIAGDTTRSFEEIETAAVAAQEAQVKRSNIQIKIAQEELAIIRIRLNAQREAGKNVNALLDQETEAIIKLQDAKTEALAEELETEKIRRENARDRFERELDFAIDAFDAQKTINERIIADEKNVLSDRRSLFDETLALTDKSFRNQIKLLEDFTGQKIDIDALALESDEEAIRAAIRKQNFDDVTLGRILEIVKERKLAVQDLVDAQNDLNESEQGAIDLRKDILAQEEALSNIVEGNVEQNNKALQDLEEDREENEIANLRRRLALAKEGSVQALEIQKDLNDALLGEQEKRIEAQQKAEEAAAANREEIQKASLGLLERFASARSDARQEELSKELSETEQQQARLRELADKGVLGADQSLAAEEKKQAELERQKQQEARNQELRTAGFKILSALLEQGKSPQEAIPEVGVLLGALPAVINAIPTFFEGTEDTGKVRNALDSKGGRLSMLHDNERVIDKKNNMKMGGVSNDEAANIVQDYNRGVLGNLYDYNQPKLDEAINTNWKSNQEILNKFESLENTVAKTNNDVKRAIENKPVITDVTYNKILNELLTVMESNGKKHRTISKPKRRL
jgi:hypothetical protein